MINIGIAYWFGYKIENKERFKLIKEAGYRLRPLQYSYRSYPSYKWKYTSAAN